MTRTKTNHDIFDEMFENDIHARLIYDVENDRIKVNPALTKVFGYTQEDFVGSKPYGKSPKDYSDHEEKQLAKLINNEIDNVTYVTQKLTKGGSALNTVINAYSIKNPETLKPKYIIKQYEEYSETEQLKQELKQKQFLIKQIMKEMPDYIYFKDLESKYIMVSDSLAKLFGFENKYDLIGKSDLELFDEEYALQVHDDEQNIIETERGLDKVEKTVMKDGSIQYVHLTKKPLRDENGEIIGTFGISKDVTDKKEAEENVRKANLEVSIKNKELSIMLENIHMIRKQVDKANEEVTEKNKVLSHTLENLKSAQAQLVSAEKLAALGQIIAGIAHEINTPLGAIMASSSNIQSSFKMLIENIETSIVNFNNAELNFMKLIIDKYKSNKATMLISREKRQIKKDIISKLAEHNIPDGRKIADTLVYFNMHSLVDNIVECSADIDYSKVLTISKNLLSLLKNSENIIMAGEKATGVVLALKKYIHKTPDGSKIPTDIIDNIETVLTLNHCKIKQGIEVVKNYDELSLVDMYPDEISQVWNNLITNAIHAMNNKGTLTIDLLDNGDTVLIKFTDTGSGIPEDVRDKIFTPFFTTKSSGQGTGLGLDIIKKIVDKHSGSISFDSEVGVGTTFIIEIPKK